MSGTKYHDRVLGGLLRAANVLRKLVKHRDAWPFLKPVDVASLGLDDYHTIVKEPMDLGTVKTRLQNQEYDHPDKAQTDIALVFNNCLAYNPQEHDVSRMAKTLKEYFEQLWVEDVSSFMEDANEDVCDLCNIG
eukprot:gene28547-35406_t